MARGKLHVYLGAAPGVGKTYDMLGEGHRRRDRGQDVVVGVVETHDRPLTARMAEGLEVVPRQTLRYRGGSFTEMDVDAVLTRRPDVVLVDELAHSNVSGARNEKRWQDVEELLDAGVRVITTVNIQHLESLNDVVESITGVTQRETIPDHVVRRADQIELVDMSPEALRRRLAHGNVYPPEKIDAALANYFRAGNLTALRELALLWVADRVDEALEKYRADHDITSPWPARERVVVAITGGAEGETVIRRAARISAHAAGSDLLAVHVTRSDGLTGASPRQLAHQRALVESLGGSFHQVVGDDVATALVDFAEAVNATQLVLGSSRRNRLQHLLRPGVGGTVPQLAEDIDVHIVPHEHAGTNALPALRRPGLGRRRLLVSWLLALLGPPLLTVALAYTRELHGLPNELLLFLALVVGNALVGGLIQASVSAVIGSLLLNFFFTPPLYTWTIAEPENAVALVIFVLVGIAVASVVDIAARRTAQAARARAEADTMSTLTGSVLRGERGVEAVLERVRETFGMESVALLERADPGEAWRSCGSVGVEPAGCPEDADVDAMIGDGKVLTLRGRVLPAADRRVLETFAAHASALLERQRLAEEARESRRLAEANRIRSALLAAVSHDLRTPIAGIKASASSLRQTDVELSPADQADLLAGIEESADRLDRLVANLLDMSRVQSGAVRALLRDVQLDEVFAAALLGIPESRVEINLPDGLPPVHVDAGLLERVVANIVTNALRHSPDDRSVTLTGSSVRDRVEIRVIDRGPGVSDGEKDAMFLPFQRLGDAPRGDGVGLGLAVARGFCEVMAGELSAEDTPGGGLTMVIDLPTGPLVAEPARTGEPR